MLRSVFIGLSPFIFIILFSLNAGAQKKVDTILVSGAPKDSTTKNILSQDTTSNKFSPRIATIRSALIPGWGQAYNKKYWKIPVIYAALGTTAGFFIYNLKTYKQLRQAFIYRTIDTANIGKIDPLFRPLSTESIRSYRNAFRQNVDYNILFFLAIWAVNVVDATVDAHLKSFDVNDNISLKLKPGVDVRGIPVFSIAFNIHEKHLKQFTLP